MNNEKIEALRVAAMVAVGTGQLNTENERTLYEAAEAVAKMQTDAQRTDLIVQAITAIPRFGNGYGWTLYWGDLTFKHMQSTGGWPRKPEALAFFKAKTGLDLIADYKTAQTKGDDWVKVTQWVRDKVASLPRLDRGQYLHRLHKIERTGGMGAQTVKHRMVLNFSPPTKDVYGNPDYGLFTPHLIGLTLEWWGDGSMTIHSENVGKDGDLFQLYQWEGCEHEFDHRLISNCYHGYRCKHCGHSYNIDSGD